MQLFEAKNEENGQIQVKTKFKYARACMSTQTTVNNALDSITSYQRLRLSKINYENNTYKILAHKLPAIVKEKSSKQQGSK